MEKSEIEMIEDLENFLKKAFCIDGDCKLIGSADKIEIKEIENFDNKMHRVFELTDSARGKFYVTLSR